MVFLRKEPQAAPVRSTKKSKIRKLELAPVRATTASAAEAQRIWAEHERWLQQASLSQARAA